MAVPADDRVLRRDARSLDLRGFVRALISSPRAAGLRRLSRRPAGAALLLFALERNQGARRRGDDRARLRLARQRRSVAGRARGRRSPPPSPWPRCSRFSAPPEWCGCSCRQPSSSPSSSPAGCGRPPGWRSDWSHSSPSCRYRRSRSPARSSAGRAAARSRRAPRSPTSDTRWTRFRSSASGRRRDFRDQPGDAAGRVRSHRRPARGSRRGPCARLAAASAGNAAVPRHRRRRGPASSFGLERRRPQLAVAECQGDGRGLAGPGRRRSSRRRGALRDRTPRRGGADRRQRSPPASCGRTGSRTRTRGSRRARGSRSWSRSGPGSPARGRR